MGFSSMGCLFVLQDDSCSLSASETENTYSLHPDFQPLGEEGTPHLPRHHLGWSRVGGGLPPRLISLSCNLFEFKSWSEPSSQQGLTLPASRCLVGDAYILLSLWLTDHIESGLLGGSHLEVSS